MRDVLVGEVGDLLTAQECADLVGITRDAWSSYVTRDVAPRPHQVLGHPPVWERGTVSAWKRAGEGRGVRRRVRS